MGYNGHFGVIWAHAGHQPAVAEIPGWRLEPTLLVALLVMGGAYLYAVGPLRERRRLGPPFEGWRALAFLSGLLILLLDLASPLDGVAEHYLFSVHMTQHLILMLLVAPLLIVGIPPWLMRVLPHSDWLWAAARWLTSPLVAFFLASAALMIWHLPKLYEAALANRYLHDLEHSIMLAGGILMWWPAMGRIRALPRLSPPAQILYYFLLPVPASLLGALITFSGDLLYPTYASAPRLWDISAQVDQELAGLIMWVPGKLVFWVALAIVFFRWFSAEDKAEERRARPDI